MKITLNVKLKKHSFRLKVVSDVNLDGSLKNNGYYR